MGDEKITLSQAKTIKDWVNAYLDDDSIDLSKAKKFDHLQKVSQFGAFCYLIQKDSKTAHIDFFQTNYTHTDAQVAKAAEFASRLLQKMYENGGTLSHADFDAVNASLGLFAVPVSTEIKNDYIKLAKTFDEHIPKYSDPAKTTTMLTNLNDDMVDIQSDHIRLLHATGSKSSCLERNQIYEILDASTEKIGGIWADAKKEKSAAEKELMKQQEEAIGKRVDAGIKIGKVGLLGAGSFGCIGAVVSGLFWPALGLIPIFVLGKKWLPDMAGSLGALYENHKKRVAAKFNIRKAQAKQDYIQKGPDALTFYEKNVLLSQGDKILLDKQRKSFDLFYGKESIKEMTTDYLNLGNLEGVNDVDNLVPADARAVLENAVSGLRASSNPAFDDVLSVAKMLKTLESKLPTDTSTLKIKEDFYEEVRKYYNGVLFGSPYSSQQLTKAQNEARNDAVMSELIKNTGASNISQKVENSIQFIETEKVQMPTVDGSGKTVETLGNYGVNAVALLTNNTADVVTACSALDGGYVVTPSISAAITRIFSADSNEQYANIITDINTAAPVGSKPETNKYLIHMLDLRRNTVKLKASEIGVADSVTIAGASYGTDVLIANLKMMTSAEGLSNIGKITSKIGSDEFSLDEIRTAITDSFASDIAKRDLAMAKLEEQVRRLEASDRFQNREFMMDQIQKGIAGTYQDTIKKIKDINFAESDKANVLFAELKTNIGISKKLDYFTVKIRDQMERVFMDESRVKQKYQDSKPETLDNIVAFMIKVRGAEYFNEGQKARLFKVMEANLERALNEKLRNMEKNLLVNVEKSGEIMTELDNFITQSYGSGFKEFFDNGSVASNNVKARIERLTTALGNTLLLQAGGKNGSPLVVDGNKQDTQIYLALYFDDSTNRDDIIKELTDLQDISQKSNFDALQTNGVDASNPNCFLKMLENKVNDITASSSTYGKKEQLAMLLIAKKRALAMFKAHLEKYYRAHNSNYTTDMVSVTGDYANIYLEWKSVLQLIDGKITALETHVDCAPIVKGRKCGNAVTTLDSIGSNTITNYYSSATAQPGLA